MKIVKMNENDEEDENEYIIVDGVEVNARFWKFFTETQDVGKAFRLMDERPDAREEPKCVICTNNYHEAELERDELEGRIKA